MKNPPHFPNRIKTPVIHATLAALCLAWCSPWASAAAVSWTGAGDGISWQDPLNWSGGVVPTAGAADVVDFGVAVNVQLGGAASSSGLVFFDSAVLGSFGNNSLFSLTGSPSAQNITVDGGVFATINNRITTTGATPGIYLGGGGTLYLSNINNFIDGNITVDGSTLMVNPNFTVPHVTGTGTGLNNRSDWNTLSQVQKRSLILTNGGVFKMIGAGGNTDGNNENFVIGNNGGGINVAGGFQQLTVDDHPTAAVITDNQIQVAATATNASLTKTGNGRLTIGDSGGGPDFNLPLTGTVAGASGGTGLIINRGVVDFATIENSAIQTTAVASRFSALSSFAAVGASVAQSTVTINNGGMLVVNSGTSSKLDTHVILNPGGVIGGQANAHYLGNFDAANGATFATTTNVPIFTANGGTILARDAFSTQTQRFIRMRDMMIGTGTVDILGETSNGSAPRIVFERGDLMSHNAGFTGTWRLLENMTLESNPRNQTTGTLATGKPIGNGTVEFAGFNSGLDLREATTGASDLTNYQSNTLLFSTTMQGVNRVAMSGGVSPNYHFGTMTLTGNQYVQLTSGQNSLLRTDNLNFAANSSPTIDTWTSSLRVEGAVNAPTVNLTKLAGPTLAGLVDLHLANATTLNNLNIRAGSVILDGANGALALSGGNTIKINAGAPGSLAQGALVLDNNNTFYFGTAAATNANRVPDAQGIEMRGGLLQLRSQNGTSVSEVVGNVSVPVGFATVDATRAGAETATLTLGAGSALGPRAVGNFTGTTLGGTAGQIFLGGVGPTNVEYLGPNFIVNGNDFAANGANGIRVPTAGAGLGYTLETTGAWTSFVAGTTVKVTTAALVAMPANTTARSLNVQVAGTLNTNSSTLTLEDGGLLLNAHTISGGAAGGITAGTSASAANLFLTNAGGVTLNARVTDNLAGGSVTLVKSGAGTLTLGHQTGVSYNQQGVLTGTPHTNTSTGGWVVNSGVFSVQHPNYLGTASATNKITLAGGQLNLDMLQSTSNSQFALGHDVVVEANSRIGMDNNAGTANGMKINNQFNLGSLSVNSGSILSYSSFDNYDARFNTGANFAPGAMLESLASDGNSHIILNGAITGTAPTFIADRAGGGNPNSTINQGGWASITYGGGATDTVATTLTGDTLLEGGILRLDKANGTNAVGSGNFTINGGSLYFGPGQNAQTWGAMAGGQMMTFNGFGLVTGMNDVSLSASGQNQIPDSATITLLGGNLGENNRVNNERIGTLNMRNGQFSPGLGTFSIGTANIAGGNVAFNTGSILQADNFNLLPGAPNISIAAGNSPATLTVLDVTNATIAGQSIFTGQGGSLTNGMGKMILRNSLAAAPDPLNAGSYTVGIFQQTGSGFRTLSQNSTLDLAGGSRSFNIDEQVMFTISSKIENGNIVKDGKGWLGVEAFVKNTYNDLTVNQGTVFARGMNGLGQSATASTNTINLGGTLRLEDLGVLTNEHFVINGPGAELPGSRDAAGFNPVLEEGALVNEKGANTITGTVAIANDAVISSRAIQAGGLTQPGNGWIVPNNNLGYLAIDSAAGITGSGSLTLTGNANGRLLMGLNTGATGSLIKAGNGDWAINGASNYAGTTEISAGSLTISHNNALGTTAGATTVNGGASLRLEGGLGGSLNVPETINIAGAGTNDASGAIVNLSGNNTISGAVNLKFPSTIVAASGSSLQFNGGVTGGKSLTLAGAGSFSAGNLALGTGSLTKNGSGTASISGTGVMAAVNLNGGTIGVANGNAIPDTTPVNLGGGTLRADGGTEVIGGLNVNAGGGKVFANLGNVSLGAITRTAGGSVDYSSAGGTIATTAPAGILQYATFGSTAHAQVSGGNVVAFSTYTNVDGGKAILSGDNETTYSININSNAGIAANTLRLGSGSGGVALGTGSLALDTDTLISNSTSNAGITGTGQVKSVTGDLYVAVSSASGSLDISAPLNIVAGGNLVKSGAGTLVLSNNANVIPGNIYVNEGTLSIVGPGGTTHPGALGTLTGLRTIALSGGALSIPFGDYDPSPSGINNMAVAIGAAGGTLNIGAGNLLLNDVGQFSAAGDITKVGGGRVQIGFVNNANIGAASPDNIPPYTPPYPVRGNINVNEGILEMVGSAGGLGSVKENVITVSANGTLVTAANAGSISSRPFANDVVVNSGGQLFSRNSDTRFDGQVTLSGNTTVNLIELDLHNQNRSIWMGGRVVQSGVTNVVATNNGSALFLLGSANDIRGSFNLGANATLEARGQGTLGDGSVNPTINLNGANSRFLLRSEQNSDFYANVNVNNTGEIGADRPNSGGIGGNQLLSINNLNINTPANRGLVTLSGGNTYAVRVNGTATISGSPRLNTTGADLVLSQGATVNGDLLKYSGTSIISEGPLAISGRAIINNGNVFLRGTNGSITGTANIELRGTGAALTLDNGDNTPNTNRLPDTVNLILGGGALRVAGQENVLAASVTAAAGQTAIGFTPGSVSSYGGGVTPLTLTGFTRTKGASINFTNDVFGTPGNLSSGQLINNTNNVNTTLGGAVQVSPRILIPGLASVTQAAAQDANGLVNSVIPWAVGQNNEFVQYDTTTIDAGAARGIYYLLNGNYTNDAVTAGLVNRWTTAKTLTSVSVPAIKLDAGVNHTLAAGNTLTVTQGAIISVTTTTQILGGGSITTGPTGANEFFLTINGNTVIEPAITEGPVGTAVVKNGAATLNLNVLGNNTSTAPASTFTGGFYHNAGVTESRAPNKIPAANLITMAGGTLSFNPEFSNTGAAVTVPAANTTVSFGNDVRFVGNSLFRVDNGLNAGAGIAAGTGNYQLLFGKLTVESGIHAQFSGFDSADMQFLNGAQIGQVGGQAPIIDVADAGGGGAHTTRVTGNLNAPTGFLFTSSAVGNGAIFELGGGTADTVANTIGGPVTVMAGTLQFNKAAGTAALTSDLIVNGGTVTQLQDNQISDTVNVELNQGTFTFGGKTETIASFTQYGGLMSTGASGIQTITGNYIQHGIGNGTDGLQVNSGAVFNIGGNLLVDGLGKVVVGAGAGTRLNVAGDVTLMGTAMQINTGGSGSIGITGSFNTLASAIPSYLGVGAATAGVGTNGLGDGTIKVDLLNTKAFNIADGAAGDDLIANGVLQNGAGTGGIIKNGAGTMVLSGTVANTYTGPTTVNNGVLVLNKTAGQNAVPGNLTIAGGRVVHRQSNQIADNATVVMSGTSVLDLETANASEIVGNITGASGSKILLGSGSLLTTGDASTTTYAGTLHGAGGLTKQGTGKFVLTGDSDYAGATNINAGNLQVGSATVGSLHGTPVFVNTTGILSGTGSVSTDRTGILQSDAAVSLLPGGLIEPGDSPGILTTGSLYTTGGAVNFELGGLTAGNGIGFYDQLAVQGSVSLTGTTLANFSVFGAHTTSTSDIYFLLKNDGTDAIVGTFDSIPEGATVVVGGTSYTATYLANAEASQISGGNDFALVPEPTAALLALLTGLGLSLRRRRQSPMA